MKARTTRELTSAKGALAVQSGRFTLLLVVGMGRARAGSFGTENDHFDDQRNRMHCDLVRPLLTEIAALAVAAVVATVVTWLIVAIVFAAADGQVSPSLGMDLVATSVLATIFGFPGAFVFLAAGFSLIRNRHHKPKIYLWTGAAVGLAHSLTGLSLRLAYQQVGPASYLEDIIGSLTVWGGFFLTNSPRVEVIVATFLASCVAGAISGLLYAKMVRRPPQPAHA